MGSLIENIINMNDKITKSIKRVNNGGCIHYAYYVSKKLTELQIEHKIVFVNRTPVSLTYSDFFAVVHVLVYIPTIGYIDSDGIYVRRGQITGGYRYCKSFKVSLTKLNRLRSEYIWNPRYKTVQNEKLEKLVNKHLNFE